MFIYLTHILPMTMIPSHNSSKPCIYLYTVHLLITKLKRSNWKFSTHIIILPC